MTTNNYIKEWVNGSEKNKRLYVQEGLILDVTEAIWGALEDENISRKDLAKKLGTSKSNVTQLLNGNRNMTLRTLADIAYVLDLNVNVDLYKQSTEIDVVRADASGWQGAEAIIPRTPVSKWFDSIEMERANDEWFELEEIAL